jgi:hypothetical protein
MKRCQHGQNADPKTSVIGIGIEAHLTLETDVYGIFGLGTLIVPILQEHSTTV